MLVLGVEFLLARALFNVQSTAHGRLNLLEPCLVLFALRVCLLLEFQKLRLQAHSLKLNLLALVHGLLELQAQLRVLRVQRGNLGVQGHFLLVKRLVVLALSLSHRCQLLVQLRLPVLLRRG